MTCITMSTNKLEFYTKCIQASEKMFVKYILIYNHSINKDLEWPNYNFVPFLHQLMKRFSNILISTLIAAIG